MANSIGAVRGHVKALCLRRKTAPIKREHPSMDDPRPQGTRYAWSSMSLLLLALVGQFSIAQAGTNSTDLITDFFEGEVQIVDFNYATTRFRLVENDAVVDVRNDIHIRLVENPYALPAKFPILAPMTAVKTIRGVIPPSCIRRYPLRHYIVLRQEYEKKVTGTRNNILSKQDADYIFALNRSEWEKYVLTMTYPDGWKVRRTNLDTGTGVAAFDPRTGRGLSIQPFFGDEKSPPDLLLVGSYFAAGTLSIPTKEFLKDVEQEATADLGSAYSVSASH